MGITIVIKDGKPKGKTRTRIDKEVLGEKWGTTSFRTEEDADKASFLERKIKKHYGADNSMVSSRIINNVE